MVKLIKASIFPPNAAGTQEEHTVAAEGLTCGVRTSMPTSVVVVSGAAHKEEGEGWRERERTHVQRLFSRQIPPAPDAAHLTSLRWLLADTMADLQPAHM